MTGGTLPTMAEETHPEDAGERRRRLDELEAHLRSRVGDRATVDTEDFWPTEHNGPAGVRTVVATPRRTGAVPISIVQEQWLVVSVGRIGGRWELGYTDADVRLGRQFVDAAVAGRVSETFAFGRSRVEVLLDDGTTRTAIGYEGCLAVAVVLPGWSHWGRRVHYEPYD